jgi:hypothetical protein
MFEVNDCLDVKIATGIGPHNKSVVVIDDFYKNPDEVRQLCLSSGKSDDKDLISSLPGTRTFVETDEVKAKLKNIFYQLCFDTNIWNRHFDYEYFYYEWERSGFLCNVINDETLLKNPMGIIPHQDSYRMQDKLMTQFGSVIYLNTPEECVGGTNLYSFCGEMTLASRGRTGIPNPEKDPNDMTKQEIFNHIRKSIDAPNGEWKVEHEFEMVYNRCILYEADLLHSQNVDLGMFTEYDRINQVLFM